MMAVKVRASRLDTLTASWYHSAGPSDPNRRPLIRVLALREVEMDANVVVVGSLNMDLVVCASRIPQPGETIIGTDFQTVPGGKGANQAVAAARLGAQVSMVGRLGDDGFGATLRTNLAAAGVESSFVTIDPDTSTGVALITVDADGQNSIVVAPGANMRLSPADVDAAEPVILGADILLLQLEIPIETVMRAAQIAHAHGITVVLNPAPASPVGARLLALVDVLVPNESETALLAGQRVDTLREAQAAALALRRQGVDTVILTLGGRGALLARGEAARRFPAFQVAAVDTTAAGDAFVAGLAVAMGEGRPLEEAVRWGNGAGALAATKLGAQPSLPARDALEAFLGSASLRTD
jgi:ribokinase